MRHAVIARTVAAFADLPQVDEVLVVCRPADVDAMSALLPQEKVSFVFGGKTRQGECAKCSRHH